SEETKGPGPTAASSAEDLAQEPLGFSLRARAVAHVLDAVDEPVHQEAAPFQVELTDVQPLAPDHHHALIRLEQHLVVIEALHVQHAVDGHGLPVLQDELVALPARGGLGADAPFARLVQRSASCRPARPLVSPGATQAASKRPRPAPGLPAGAAAA